MTSQSKMHFEMSERKILLRFFDVVFALGFLHLLGVIFDFYYFKITGSNYYWSIVFVQKIRSELFFSCHLKEKLSDDILWKSFVE